MILEVKNLEKSYLADKPVLRDVSLSLEVGQVIAIIGSSGSGKSTLLRCITQLERINRGEIVINGEAMVTTNEEGKAVYADKATLRRLQRDTGMVFQSFNLFPHFSVLRNVTDALIHVRKTPKAEAESIGRALLEKMGLADRADDYPCQLSGGQQQRVAIARALALSPAILCFDEPTSALDPELTGEVLKVIRGLREERHTMIVVTHEMEFARNVADYIIFMADGIIEEQGPAKEILDHPTTPALQAFLRHTKSNETGEE